MTEHPKPSAVLLDRLHKMRQNTDLQMARAASAERFLAVARAIKEEAGVVTHRVRKKLTGRAWSASGLIQAPEGKTRQQLYLLAHEAAHVALKHQGSGIPKHRQEYEAEVWAHAILRRHGISVPRCMTRRAKLYVAWSIVKDERVGVEPIDADARRFSRSATLLQ